MFTRQSLMRFALVLAFASSVACATKAEGPTSPLVTFARPAGDVVAPASTSGAASGASKVAADRIIGSGVVLGNLVVYPITSKSQVDVGPLVLLDDALAKGDAEVRETDASGSVNTLVIENKAPTPLFVLAGTIVKGGKQDRQIGQDFIIGAKDTTRVDAFCVEHGRWSASRDGQATGNVFRTSDTITTSKVRAAGQYKKDQGEVWSKVTEANQVNKKSSASDTYLATVDDAEVTKQRNELAGRITAALDGVGSKDDVVGIAYAIDGEPKGARWFTHHKVFTMVEKKLAAGIALEAISAKTEAEARGEKPATKAAPTAQAVDTFIREVETQTVKERRDTAGQNANDYRESAKGYGSSTMMKAAPKTAVPVAPATKPVSVDVLAK